MAEFEARVEVAAAPAESFEYLADFVNVAEWDPSVRSAIPLADGPPVPGSTYVVTTGFYGKPVELIYEITELESPTRLAVSIEGGRAHGRNEFEIEPCRSGSSISYRVALELRGMARLLDRGLQLALDGMGENATGGLRSRLGSS